MAAWDWPWQYKFPPFYTLQPNAETRKKQIQAWTNLILSYYKHHKLFKMDIKEAQSKGIFTNSEINRTLSSEGVSAVLKHLESQGNLEWENGKQKDRCYILWRTFKEWADVIYKWVFDSGLTDTVLTLYELHAGDDTTDQEFHGIDIWVLRKALQELQTRGKAELFYGNDPSEEGVKFFL